MKKILVVGVVLLFLGSSIPLIASQPLHGKHIITVDDDGDGDYTSIRDAVNHSHPEDIIEVYSGTYAEDNILIKTPNITLIGLPYEPDGGNHTGKPLIVRKGYMQIIQVEADKITITGFILQDNHSERNPFYQGQFIDLFAANECLISNNTIQNGTNYSVGIDCYNSTKIQIINNSIKNMDWEGIYLEYSNNASVSGNSIIHSQTGVSLFKSKAINITKNKINGCGTGIALSNSQNNTLYLNNLENNSLGVQLVFSTKNIIKHNNFIKNSQKAELIAIKFPIIQRWKSIFNSWIDNYWGHRLKIVPKMIPGLLFLIIMIIPTPEFGPFPIAIPLPFFQFDRHPAQTPYVIP
jgi:parallel beta-helix repeat protein